MKLWAEGLRYQPELRSGFAVVPFYALDVDKDQRLASVSRSEGRYLYVPLMTPLFWTTGFLPEIILVQSSKYDWPY